MPACRFHGCLGTGPGTEGGQGSPPGRNEHASEGSKCHRKSTRTPPHPTAGPVIANSEGLRPRRWGRQGTVCSTHPLTQLLAGIHTAAEMRPRTHHPRSPTHTLEGSTVP